MVRHVLFDALIGNTDRHQDNWGLLWNSETNKARMAPVFDNGTSLGHEISPLSMRNFDDAALRRYVGRGAHHIRWCFGESRVQHADMVRRLCGPDWGLREHITALLSAFNPNIVTDIITCMTNFDIRIPLSAARAEFACRLIVNAPLSTPSRSPLPADIVCAVGIDQ